MSAAVAIDEKLSTWNALSPLNEEADTSRGEGGKPLFYIDQFKGPETWELETGLTSTHAGTRSLLAKDKVTRHAAVVVPKSPGFTHNKFVPLQKWEGVVLKTTPESFFARLVDLTTRGVEEEVEFPLDEAAPSDRELLMEGAVFYWDIGYLDQIDGQRVRASSLRFRRLPAWSEKDIREAEEKAKRLEAAFANG